MDTENTSREETTENSSEKDTQAIATPGNEEVTPTSENKTDDQPSFNKESLLADLHKERSVRKELKSKVEELESKLQDSATLQANLDSVQAKYDRLESFLLAFGGNIGKALDSRSFTKDLFESDKPVEELVAEWNKANPSKTSSALGSSSAEGGSTLSLSDLIRAASH